MYIVKVTLKDNSVQTFEYDATDAWTAVKEFQNDSSEETVNARNNSINIEASPA